MGSSPFLGLVGAGGQFDGGCAGPAGAPAASQFGLTGPRLTDPNGSADWNIHEWDFK